MARVVATLLGYDQLPGTTVNRYCSSSLQTTRMAFHAIKAGEADVFVSGGCGDREPLRQGAAVTPGPTPQPGVRRRRERTDRRRAEGGGPWHDPREDGNRIPDVYIAMGADRGERRLAARHHPGRAGRVRRALAEPGREGHRRRVLAGATSPRSRCPTAARSSQADDGPRPGTTTGQRSATLKPVFRARRHGDRRQLLPAQRRRRCRRHHERHQGGRARPHPAGPDRLHRVSALSPGDHGPRPGRGVPAGAGAGRAWPSATSTWSRSTRRSRPR